MIHKETSLIGFRVGAAIQNPDDFIGREDLLQDITKAMLNLQHLFLHGERRTGKTSLLLYLAHPDLHIQYPEYHIPVYFNFQSVSEASEANVWEAIADAIAQQIRQRYPEREADCERFLATIAEFQNISKTIPLFPTGFGSALSDLHMAGFKINLLFDEFDQTADNPNLGDPFYNALRSLPVRGGNLSYVVASRTGLESLQPIYNKVSSPFFNIFTRRVLKPFCEEEVYQFIFYYLAVAELDFFQAEKLCNEVPFLHETTGYHSFFLQLLCYHLCARSNEPEWPKGRAKEEALRAFEQDAEPHFAYYWDVSSQEEQKVMKKLASGQAIDWNRQSGVAYRLQDRCLSVKTDSGWRLFSSAFVRWINEMAPKESYQPPIRSADAYDFVNREQDLSQLCALLEGHPYLHLYGPSGIGKTDLIAHLLQTRYAEHHTAYLDLNDPKFRAKSQHPERLLREIGRQFYNSLLYRALSLPELISNLSYKINQTAQSGVIVLDNIDRMPPDTMRQLRKETLPALQDKIADPTLYLRVIAISPYEIEELSGLTDISFQPYYLDALPSVLHDFDTYQALLRQAVARWGKQPLDPHDAESNNLLKRWANELYNLTGGHLAAIEGTLNYVGRHTQFAGSDLFEAQHQAICQHILTPLVEQAVQASLPTLEYQQAFQQLWIFRYFSKGVFEQLLTEAKGKSHWRENGMRDETDWLWERLIKTPLLLSNVGDERLLSHQLTPIWRRMGNQILQSNPTLYRTLHKDARTVFEDFADHQMDDTNLRVTCFVEALYHLTQEATVAPSEPSRRDFTRDLLARLNHFLSSLKGDARFDDSLYKLNYLLENDPELRAELKRVGEPDSWPQLMSMISTTRSTEPVKPQLVRGREAIYALECEG
ncbi:MAG: AAA family ATPase [Ardenticatenaceae bacterium]